MSRFIAMHETEKGFATVEDVKKWIEDNKSPEDQANWRIVEIKELSTTSDSDVLTALLKGQISMMSNQKNIVKTNLDMMEALTKLLENNIHEMDFLEHIMRKLK